jgi:hypothetical protein
LFPAKENDDPNWIVYKSQMFPECAFEMAFDLANRILHAGHIRAGAWAFKVQ